MWSSNMLLFTFLCIVAITQSILTGEIVSCPACKLNSLPQVRTFIKTNGHADSYENVKITFIRGHNPDFIIRDEKGNVVEKIDMSNYSTEGLHKLFQEKGFLRKASGVKGSTASV